MSILGLIQKGRPTLKHPFIDGNGRTGRVLNILYLIEQELLNLPVLYLSRYMVNNKADYYHPDLMESLEVLTKNRNENIPVRWRRPNNNGIFGIVTAVRWENRKKSEVFGSSDDDSGSSK
ncbi:Fic family protein [Endozoicomonas sp. SCSIO W0465]|uniref:Fic family protein n=1 Tax=Endozoicomonas sp. SCSIO W0465 TaxID=2918516 RepID=UPI003531CB9E